MKVNRTNCESANNFEHVSMKNADKTPLRVRRNGKTKLWKTRPEEFEIPVKYGLYGYTYITQYNCNEWEITN